MSSERPSLWRAWWPAVIWILLIAVESTDYFSSENTGSALYSLLTRVFGVLNLYDFLVWHHYLRKAGHVVGYGILCLLLLRGWRTTFARAQRWVAKPALLAWLVTVLVASLDEWHQTLIPSRTGRVQDVFLDSAAGLMALVLLSLIRRSIRAPTGQT